MPTQLNEHIFDSTISLNLDLIRLDKNTQKEVIVILKKMERDLIALLSIDDLTAFNKARLKQQLAEAKFVINQYYDEMAAANLAATSGVPLITATQTAGALSVATGDLVKGVGLLPTTAYMESLAGNAIIQGATQKDWWKRQSADMTWRFNSAVRQGLVGSETNQQIVKRVRESIDISKRNATTLVRTSVMTVANEARQSVYEDHADVIQSLIWSATLDARVCMAKGTKVLTPNNGEVNIESLSRYDLVIGNSGNSRKVLSTQTNTAVRMARIKLSNGKTITCTQEHRFLNIYNVWIEAKDLFYGMGMMSQRKLDRHYYIESIKLYELDEPTEVYDIEVDIDESFIVAGIVAHNCPECAVRDNKEWDLLTKKPIGHSIPYRTPPIHHNDRCSILPRLKTFRELGIDIDEVPAGKRASMEGLVEDQDWENFAKRKGDKVLDSVLGIGRAKLYREKKITFDQLLDSQGNEMSLKDLTDKYVN